MIPVIVLTVQNVLLLSIYLMSNPCWGPRHMTVNLSTVLLIYQLYIM